jgi:hypothetical protein
MARRFENYPIVAWAIDEFSIIEKACQDNGIDLNDKIERYGSRSFDNEISKIFSSSPFKLNLGGATDKSRLIATDKPIGVFNFSLASRSLYPLPEYYSSELAKNHPDRFDALGLLSGIVPADMVQSIVIGGVRTFIFRDKVLNKEFYVEKRIKGETAINAGIEGAKKKYASKTKKVYQTYQKKGGKVRYVEIYSLFYYTSLNEDFQFAVRHLPAQMVADYLENQGIKTRIYMTRFVEPRKRNIVLKKVSNTGVKLPMGNTNYPQDSNYLLIQPIIAKDFQQEMDKKLGFCISSDGVQEIYQSCAYYTTKKEVSGKAGRDNIYGNPDWNQVQYWEGIERYRNKYQQYVKLGIFKAKEVLPEAMVFFHDPSIAKQFTKFSYRITSSYYNTSGEVEVFLKPEVNRFFNWWMKTSANTIKHKINIINSNSFYKDLKEIEKDLYETISELKTIIAETTHTSEYRSSTGSLDSLIYQEFGDIILEELKIVKQGLVASKNLPDVVRYVNQIVEELTTFADGGFYPTPDDDVKKRLEFKNIIFDELKKFK